jgi:hypothetical protein
MAPHTFALQQGAQEGEMQVNHRRKLTDAQREEIIEKLRLGRVTRSKLAVDYGVSVNSIQKLVPEELKHRKINKQTQPDLTGQKFGRWTVLHNVGEKDKGVRNAFWQCRCGCGNERSISRSELASGTSKQCRECAGRLSAPIRIGEARGRVALALVCGCVIRVRDRPRQVNRRYPCPSNLGHGYQVQWASYQYNDQEPNLNPLIAET